ncbi:MAG: HAMP domain-containing histidine kinase [Candidatus Dormibacteraeota bacterium]|nr:HAMP domain-containing histidine kinase [Candidatus Dormibacteraeota bacterium]
MERGANRIVPARYPALMASLGASAGLALLILVGGLLLKGTVVLPWFIPVMDLGAVICLLPTAILAGIDAYLRRDSRSLPVAGVAVGVSLLWIAHFVLFPGDIPGIAANGDSFASETTSWLFLGINFLMPVALAVALTHTARPVSRPGVAIVMTAGIALAAGLVACAAAGSLAAIPLHTVQPDGSFSWIVSAVGVAGLLPAMMAFALIAAGRQGDVRIAGGVLAALTFSAIESIALLFLQPRFSPVWYALHALAFLPAVALLAGQLQIYVVSVRAEQTARADADRVAAQLRAGFDLAVEMATQVDTEPLIRRLLEGARSLVDAERATLLRIEGEVGVVESGVDTGARPAPAGVRNPLTAVRSEVGLPIVAEAVRSRRTVISGPYRVDGLAPDHAASLIGLRHTMVVPLVLRGEVIAAMILSRRHDPSFTEVDSDRLRELTVISALLLRNVRLLDSAQEGSAAKSRFLNMAAHELRTPLSVISGYVDMLLGGTFGELDGTMAPPLRILSDKTMELSRQVEKLLTASRLDASTGASSVQEVDMALLASEAVKRVQPRADLMGAEIAVQLPAEAILVAADPDDVSLVLDNLLNNALTYSQPPPRISVSVQLGSECELRVEDRGIGIPMEQAERIFEQFHRVENPDFGYPAGTGLGLYISRRLAERNSGSLVLERSQAGKGSVFLLTLPASQARESSSM